MEIWVDQADIIEELQDLGITTTAWELDSYAKLNKVILKSQREFERLTRRKFEKADLTEKINGTGKSGIVLRYYPINSIDSIVMEDIPGYQQALTMSEYRFEEETGRVELVATQPILIAVFPEGNLNIVATYNYGYEVADIPEDIKDAISVAVQFEVISRTPEDWEKKGLKGLRIGQYQEQYGSVASASNNPLAAGIFGPQKTKWMEEFNNVVASYKRTLVV